MKSSASTNKVPKKTIEQVNRDMLIFTESSIRYHTAHPGKITQRLLALDQEWDVERILETNASFLALGGMFLSLFHKKFLLLSASVLALLNQHAQQGWCPPLPILRRLGIRTRTEIEYERYALKLLRGDFGDTRKDGKLVVGKILDLSEQFGSIPLLHHGNPT